MVRQRSRPEQRLQARACRWRLALVAAFWLAALPAFAGIQFGTPPSLRLYQSNALGFRGNEMAVANPRAALAVIQPWAEFLAASDGFDRLAAALGQPASGAWTLVVIEGKAGYDLDAASVLEAPQDGQWLREEPGRPTRLAWLELRLLLPPAGSGETRVVWLVATIQDQERVEEEYRNGRRTSQVVYDRNGLAVREFLYRDGVLFQGWVNVWKQGRLVRTDIYGFKGLQVSNHRAYTAKGALRESWQEYPGSGSDRMAFNFLAQAGWNRWQKAPEGEEELVYDRANRLVRKELWSGKALVSRSEYQYQSPDSVLLVSILTEEPGTRSTRLQVYDEQGRMVQSDQSVAGKLVSRESFLYDESDRLVLRSLNKDRKTSEWAYEYDQDTLRVERYGENNLPVWEVRHVDGGREEDVYVKGRLSLRIRYEGTRKVSMEEYKDGKIVRSKTY